MPVAWTPVAWGACLLFAAVIFRVRFVRSPRVPRLGRASHILLADALILLAVPRLTYLLAQYQEAYNFAIPAWDDWAHVAELVSMTASGSYPLRAPSNPSYLFSSEIRHLCQES